MKSTEAIACSSFLHLTFTLSILSNCPVLAS